MPPRPVATAFLRNAGDVLIVRRSQEVRSMRGLWSAVSGGMGRGEDPLARALAEVREETGIGRSSLSLARRAAPVTVADAAYPGESWEVHPFLFESGVRAVTLNWEASGHAWVRPQDLGRYATVPGLGDVLACLL